MKYNELHIPVIIVESHDAYKLIRFIDNSDLAVISVKCKELILSLSYTQFRGEINTQPIGIIKYPQSSNDLIVHGYDNNDNIITSITFTNRSSYSFNVISSYCNIIDVSVSSMKNFYIATRTIFENIYKICLGSNSDTSSNFDDMSSRTGWTGNMEMNGCQIMSNMTKNTYCFAIWQTNDNTDNLRWSFEI